MVGDNLEKLLGCLAKAYDSFKQQIIFFITCSSINLDPAKALVEGEGGEVCGEAFQAEGAGEAVVEIGEEDLADALAEMIGTDEEMMDEAVGFPEGDEADEGAVFTFGEVDEFAFGVAGEVIELEV